MVNCEACGRPVDLYGDGPPEPEAGHRTTVEHDCFLMNCRTLGEEVLALREQLTRIQREADYAIAFETGRHPNPTAWAYEIACKDRDSWKAKAAAIHVPTPEELDLLLSDISGAGYASEATEIVENWTRRWWGVESAFTTRMDAQR